MTREESKRLDEECRQQEMAIVAHEQELVRIKRHEEMIHFNLAELQRRLNENKVTREQYLRLRHDGISRLAELANERRKLKER